MTTVDAKLMCVVAALRHGVLTLNTPGLCVNTHPNPFFLHVIGELDLKHIAERVLVNLDNFASAEVARLEREKKSAEADVATAASAVDGH
jgi:hypothetical protein